MNITSAAFILSGQTQQEAIGRTLDSLCKRIADTQGELDYLESMHIPAPREVTEYLDTLISRASAYADYWGFDIDDVLADA